MKKTLKNFKLDKETIVMLEALVGDYGKDQTAVVINLIRTFTHVTTLHSNTAKKVMAMFLANREQAKRKPRKEKK